MISTKDHSKRNIQIFLLSIVVVLGAIIRFYRLGSIPSGFHRDEAYLGYNAYSILKTGHDMTGNFLPIHISSFLYSPGGYSYLSIPAIIIFGLSPFSIRFASAFFGTLSILATYLLVSALAKFTKTQNNQNRNYLSSSVIALLSSFYLAITPWHINLSRTATENTIVVFLSHLELILYLNIFKIKEYGYSFFLSYPTLLHLQSTRRHELSCQCLFHY